MARKKNTVQIVVVESRFRLLDRRVYFGRARLLQDRIVLKAWGFRETILLKDVVDVRWLGAELTIVLANGDEYELLIDSAPMWKLELQSRCHLKDESFGRSVRYLTETRPEPVSDRPGGSDNVATNGEVFGDVATNGAATNRVATNGMSPNHVSSNGTDSGHGTTPSSDPDTDPSWYRVNRLFDADEEDRKEG